MADEIKTEVKVEAPVENKPSLIERSHLDEVIKDRDAAKAKAREYEAEIAKYRSEQADRAAKEAKSADEAKLIELAEQKKYQEALKLNDEQHNVKYRRLQEAANKKYVPSAIQAAASKIPGLTQDAIDLLPTLLKEQIQIDPETLEPTVIGPDGKVVKSIGADGVPMTIDELVQNFTKGKKTFFTDALPKGTNAHQSTSTGKEFTIENAMTDSKLDAEWQKKDPDGYQKALKAYASGAANRYRASAKTALDANNVVRAIRR